MKIRTDFPYETRHDDLRIPLPDGTRLYARVWRPLTDEPVPALLEYLPHRLTDGTASRDWQRHPWYAGHGYASVRVDVRGHGNSEGLPGDVHDATELADGVAVVEWLAAQPWCSGRVGMFGIGWGGGNSLRIAALAPAPLKAVVTVCAGDDRYGNDAHYLGGSVLAAGLHGRAAGLLAHVSRPPDPLHVGEQWRETWLKRLEAVAPFTHTWLAHQTRDDYWRRGGVDTGGVTTGRVTTGGAEQPHASIRDVAVLAVGGWHDPYRDTVLRLVEHLPQDRVRGVIGPWAHRYPDHGTSPGPAIGFLQETLRWWDHHLKGVDNDVMAEPLLRSWISDSHPPATEYGELPGRWVTDPAWPSPYVGPVTYGLQGDPVVVRSPQRTGLDAGGFVPSGDEADLPPDQREEDAHAACFDFPVPEAGPAVEVLGTPSVLLHLMTPAPTGQVVARLCDVAPDGSSTLVTRGVLNLSARYGPDRAVEAQVGEWESYTFPLSAIGHAFRPGHRVRLAVSSAYWPWIWPQPDAAGFTLDPAGSALTLPVRAHTADAVEFGEPEQSEPLGVSSPGTLEEPRPQRVVVRDVAGGEWRLEAAPCPAGTWVFPDGLEVTEEALDTYTIDESDPLTARTRSDRTIRLHRPDAEPPWDVRVETRSEITCDADAFFTSDEVVCTEGEEVVFHRTWEKRIPRTAG
ncbi:CocE/NonD family hydrolase [Streptomyces roseicoloratus]|uniref:CocE/NonD family hydrolase n=1 Tax=Streptomyces roseicoloratus TaxID=2508722 RepID=A0ABY9S341_9ACTN|nr:CocE/NonD family hydrolase [Streptomyces roseicoloratus]WMX48866.1 CocE/NonD family hydrolase [Streptomyces roseicoloratus]